MNSARFSVPRLLPVCYSGIPGPVLRGLRMGCTSSIHHVCILAGKEKEVKTELPFLCSEENASQCALSVSALTCGHRWAVGWAMPCLPPVRTPCVYQRQLRSKGNTQGRLRQAGLALGSIQTSHLNRFRRKGAGNGSGYDRSN